MLTFHGYVEAPRISRRLVTSFRCLDVVMLHSWTMINACVTVRAAGVMVRQRVGLQQPGKLPLPCTIWLASLFLHWRALLVGFIRTPRSWLHF